MQICSYCQQETTNPKYCSRSCAAKHTNQLYPKKKQIEKECKCCGEIFLKSRSLYCVDCRAKDCTATPRGILSSETTLGEAIYTLHHKSSAYALVRSRARAYAKKLGMSCCSICGYDTHVEISHKKPIHKFDLNTLISIINSAENIWALCRNHHWEFDHGILVPRLGI